MAKQNNNSRQSNSNAPVQSFRIGYIKASIWCSTGEAKFYSVTITRSYKDTDGTWKDTQSFQPQDLPVIAVLAAKCTDAILAYQDK